MIQNEYVHKTEKVVCPPLNGLEKTLTNQEIKTLKDTLWQSADTLRAESGLKSSEYATPILGIIFLRFAESKYKQCEMEKMYLKNCLKHLKTSLKT